MVGYWIKHLFSFKTDLEHSRWVFIFKFIFIALVKSGSGKHNGRYYLAQSHHFSPPILARFYKLPNRWIVSSIYSPVAIVDNPRTVFKRGVGHPFVFYFLPIN
jgi:hypothetical protein